VVSTLGSHMTTTFTFTAYGPPATAALRADL